MRRLLEQGFPVMGVEIHSNVGGLWDIDSSTSTMYQSAHLISSKSMTEFSDFPMRKEVATYPRHDQLRQYFQDYATHFDLYQHYRFNTKVERLEPNADGWEVTLSHDGKTETIQAAGVLLANGTLHHPKQAEFDGEFKGERLHSSLYNDPAIFEGKRVLIVGCGNSGCDIAVDAVHRAKSVDMVVRRGYYFLPKFVAGIAVDTLGGKIRLPNKIKQFVDGLLVRLISGKPSAFGLPDPDYKMYESHPVVNSMFLHHIGHGDIKVRPAIESLTTSGVKFKNGEQGDYDLILEATGYKLHYPFIDQKHLNWDGFAPHLYLNVFTPKHNNLFVMGMVEASGLGWQGRDDQAQLVAAYLKAKQQSSPQASVFEQRIQQNANKRIVGGMQYLHVERMAYYVHKAEYLQVIHAELNQLKQG
jgi:cation diffusion facilitator CzcD-associated flavoprotein CzcO